MFVAQIGAAVRCRPSLLGYLDHDRGLALGCACAAQSAARDLFVRAFSLRDPHDRRRRDLPMARRAVVVRAVLSRDQGAARGSCRRALRDRAIDLGAGARRHIGDLPRRHVETAFIAFVAIFPVLCEAMAEGPAFTGMRHFLFVVPPLAVLAGIGFDAVLTALSPRRWLAAGARPLLALALLWNASVLVRLHPYEYMFYNPLVGGLEGAQRRYEMDYWVNMMPEAVQRAAGLSRARRRNSRSASIPSASAARNSRSTIMPTSVCRRRRAGWNRISSSRRPR